MSGHPCAPPLPPPGPSPGDERKVAWVEHKPSPQVCRAGGHSAPSVRSQKGPRALRGSARAAGWDPRGSLSPLALSPPGENCEWYLTSQVWKTQRLPGSGTAPNLDTITAVGPLSVVCTHLPKSDKTKSRHGSAPLAKERRGGPAPGAGIAPDPLSTTIHSHRGMAGAPRGAPPEARTPRRGRRGTECEHKTTAPTNGRKQKLDLTWTHVPPNKGGKPDGQSGSVSSLLSLIQQLFTERLLRATLYPGCPGSNKEQK